MPRRLDTTAEPVTVDLYEVEVTVPRGQAVTLALGFGVLVALFVGGQAASGDLAWWAVPLRAMWRGAQAGAGLFVALFLLHAVSERVARARARGPVRKKPLEVEHAAPAVTPRTVPIIIKRAGERVHEHYDGLPIPKQGEEALARYFWRVLRDDRTLAFRNPYHIGRDEVQQVKDFFTGNQLGEDLGGNLGVKPNADGEQMMRQFVRRHYPDAHLPQDDAGEA